MLKQAFGSQAMMQTEINKWYLVKYLKNYRRSVQDEKHSGCPSTAIINTNITKFFETIRETRQTIRVFKPCHMKAVRKLKMCHIAAKFVACLLMISQVKLAKTSFHCL